MRSRNLLPFFILFVAFAYFGCRAAVPNVRDISQDDFSSNPPAGAIILDVRSSEEYASGHVPNAVSIPHDQLSARVAELGGEKGAPIVVYCESGRRAGFAATTLLEAGFTNVLHLDGDMRGWRENGRPTEQ